MSIIVCNIKSINPVCGNRRKQDIHHSEDSCSRPVARNLIVPDQKLIYHLQACGMPILQHHHIMLYKTYIHLHILVAIPQKPE